MANKIETIRIDIRFPKPLLDQVTEYQFEQGIPTRTGALIELVRIGLKATKNEQNK